MSSRRDFFRKVGAAAVVAITPSVLGDSPEIPEITGFCGADDVPATLLLQSSTNESYVLRVPKHLVEEWRAALLGKSLDVPDVTKASWKDVNRPPTPHNGKLVATVPSKRVTIKAVQVVTAPGEPLDIKWATITF